MTLVSEPIGEFRDRLGVDGHRRTLTINRVVDLDAIGRGFAAEVGYNRRRRLRQGLPPLERAGGQKEEDGETKGRATYPRGSGGRPQLSALRNAPQGKARL